MSDLIRRYDIVMFENDWMRKESPTGDYVRYEDHAIEIERLRAENEELEAENTELNSDNEGLCDLAMRFDLLKAEIERLRSDIDRQTDIAKEHVNESERLRAALERIASGSEDSDYYRNNPAWWLRGIAGEALAALKEDE